MANMKLIEDARIRGDENGVIEMTYEYTSITSIYMRSVRKKVASIETRIREIFTYDVASMDDDTRESIVDECVNILEKLNEMSWVVPHNVDMDTAHIFRCEIDEVKLSVVEYIWSLDSKIELDF